MKDTFTTLWIPFGDGRAARVRIDVHTPVLPTPLEVESPAAPDEFELAEILLALDMREHQDTPPFDIGLPPVPRAVPARCQTCNGFGFVPSRCDTDTDPAARTLTLS